MLKTAQQSHWVQSLRSGIKVLCGSGWLVSNDHSPIALEVHDPAVGKKQIVGLAYFWHQDEWAETLFRIRAINAA